MEGKSIYNGNRPYLASVSFESFLSVIFSITIAPYLEYTDLHRWYQATKVWFF